MKWLDVLQNGDEWYSLRVGKVTSSKFPVIMAHDPEDKWGDPAKRYAAQKAIERVTGRKAYESPMKNEHLDRGHEQEPIARRSYESRYFVDVTNGGFFDHDTWGTRQMDC